MLHGTNGIFTYYHETSTIHVDIPNTAGASVCQVCQSIPEKTFPIPNPKLKKNTFDM